MYNLKILTYEKTGEQDLRTYKKPIRRGRKKKKKVDLETGEIIEEKRQCSSIKELERKMNHSLNTSMNRTKNNIYEIARANVWEWFLTFTLDSKKVDRYDYDEIRKKLANWLNNVRKRKAPELVYLLVPELHKDGAFHFHALIARTGKLEFKEALNPKTGKKLMTKSGKQIYNLEDWKNGFTTATKIEDTLRAAQYITKYITKELVWTTKGKKRYWASKNVEKPVVATDLVDQETIEAVKAIEGKTKKEVVLDRPNYHQKITYTTIQV